MSGIVKPQAGSSGYSCKAQLRWNGVGIPYSDGGTHVIIRTGARGAWFRKELFLGPPDFLSQWKPFLPSVNLPPLRVPDPGPFWPFRKLCASWFLQLFSTSPPPLALTGSEEPYSILALLQRNANALPCPLSFQPLTYLFYSLFRARLLRRRLRCLRTSH